MTRDIPSYLEIIVTKDDFVVIGRSWDYYSEGKMMSLESPVTVPREVVDPEFNLNIDILQVFECYVKNPNPKEGRAIVPMANVRIKLGSYSSTDEIREYLTEGDGL